MCFVVFYPPLRSNKSITCILTPLSGGPLCICEVDHVYPIMGGMKAVMVSGDAHPYLAPLRD